MELRTLIIVIAICVGVIALVGLTWLGLEIYWGLKEVYYYVKYRKVR